jgi:hypothetical protein
MTNLKDTPVDELAELLRQDSTLSLKVQEALRKSFSKSASSDEKTFKQGDLVSWTKSKKTHMGFIQYFKRKYYNVAELGTGSTWSCSPKNLTLVHQ